MTPKIHICIVNFTVMTHGGAGKGRTASMRFGGESGSEGVEHLNCNRRENLKYGPKSPSVFKTKKNKCLGSVCKAVRT